jgi:GST-like protein
VDGGDAINARPAAQRAEALKDRFTFKTEMDEDAKKQMFPQNARLASLGKTQASPPAARP